MNIIIIPLAKKIDGKDSQLTISNENEWFDITLHCYDGNTWGYKTGLSVYSEKGFSLPQILNMFEEFKQQLITLNVG